MRTWKVALFDREEAHAIQAAQRSINIAFPLDGPDAVKADDPRRRVLGGIGYRNDPITEARLIAAQEVLRELLARTEEQSAVSYWISQLGGRQPLGNSEQFMIDTITEARRIQHREVLVAFKIIEFAIGQVAGGEEQIDSVWETAVEQAAEEAVV